MFRISLFILTLFTAIASLHSQVNVGKTLLTENGYCIQDVGFKTRYYVDLNNDQKVDQIVTVGCDLGVSVSDPELVIQLTFEAPTDTAMFELERIVESEPLIELNNFDGGAYELVFNCYESGSHKVSMTIDDGLNPSAGKEISFNAESPSLVRIRIKMPEAQRISFLTVWRPNKRTDSASFKQ